MCCVDSSWSPGAHWPSLSARLWKDFAAWLASELKVQILYIYNVWIVSKVTKIRSTMINWPRPIKSLAWNKLWRLLWMTQRPTAEFHASHWQPMPTNPAQTLSCTRWIPLNGLQVWGSLRAPASKCQRDSKDRITARAYFRWSSKDKLRIAVVCLDGANWMQSLLPEGFALYFSNDWWSTEIPSPK